MSKQESVTTLDIMEDIAKIIDPEAFGLPAWKPSDGDDYLTDRDEARDKAKVIYRKIKIDEIRDPLGVKRTMVNQVHVDDPYAKETKTTEIIISAEYADEIARKIHYPQCWDTACYPTLADAVIEIATGAGCSEHPLPKVQNFGPARIG